jgi:PST family polysaccharide transporter
LCITSILAGLSWGVTGVAASLAIAGLLVRLPVAFWLATRRGPVSMGHILTAIAPAACAAIVAAAATGALLHRVFADTGPTVAGVLLVGGGGLAAIGLTALAWPEIRRELRDTLRRFAGQRLFRWST